MVPFFVFKIKNLLKNKNKTYDTKSKYLSYVLKNDF